MSIVLSQSCEIDKHGGKNPVLTAPVMALSSIKDDAQREIIAQGARYAFFPLPRLEGVIEDSYVDLRAISYLPRAVLDLAPRHASANENGAQDLASHLVAFFTRVSMADLRK